MNEWVIAFGSFIAAIVALWDWNDPWLWSVAVIFTAIYFKNK